MRILAVGLGILTLTVAAACGGESDEDGGGTSGTGGSATGTGGATSGGTGSGATGGDLATTTDYDLAVAYCEALHTGAAAAGCESSLDSQEICIVGHDGAWPDPECHALNRALLACRIAEGSVTCTDNYPTWVGCEAEEQVLDPCWM